MIPVMDRKWIEVQTPDDMTWLVDMNFLLSGYRCIWGQGCQGAHHTKVGHDEGCCGVGVTTSRWDRQNVRRRAKELGPDEWAHYGTKRLFTIRERKPQTRLQRLDDGRKGLCIFYNREGSGKPHGCALHVAAEARGEDWTEWKPEACVSVPLWVEWNEQLGMFTLQFIERNNQWKDLDYWCGEDANAWDSDQPAFMSMEQELRFNIESYQEGAWEAIRDAALEAWNKRPKRKDGTRVTVKLRSSRK